MFQFHNGSIRSQFNPDIEVKHLGFNSTMVRLEDIHIVSLKWDVVVSIPQWFD